LRTRLARVFPEDGVFESAVVRIGPFSSLRDGIHVFVHREFSFADFVREESRGVLLARKETPIVTPTIGSPLFQEAHNKRLLRAKGRRAVINEGRTVGKEREKTGKSTDHSHLRDAKECGVRARGNYRGEASRRDHARIEYPFAASMKKVWDAPSHPARMQMFLLHTRSS